MEKGRRRWRKKSPFLCARSEKRRRGRSLQLTCSNASRQTREEAGYGDNAAGDVRLPNYYTHPFLLLLPGGSSHPTLFRTRMPSLSLLAFFFLSRKEAAKCGLRKRRRRGRLDPVRRLRFSPPPSPRGGEMGVEWRRSEALLRSSSLRFASPPPPPPTSVLEEEVERS